MANSLEGLSGFGTGPGHPTGSEGAAEVERRCLCGNLCPAGQTQCEQCHEEDEMEKPAPPAKHTVATVPLPEGAHETKSGRVLKGKAYYIKLCPKCQAVWISEESNACRKCGWSKTSKPPQSSPKPPSPPAPSALPRTAYAEPGHADLINAPPHYCAGKIECLDVIKALGFDFEEGSAMKYLFRHKRKGEPLQDLKKCRFYVDKLIARYEEKP